MRLKILLNVTLLSGFGVFAQTDNQITKFANNGTKTVDSRIFDDGSSIGFGTKTPNFPFQSNLGFARFDSPNPFNNRYFQIIPGYGGSGDIPAGTYISSGSNIGGEGLSILPTGNGTQGVKLGAYVYANNKWSSVWETKNEDAGILPSLNILKGGGWVNLGDINKLDKTHLSLNGSIVSQSNTDVSFNLVQGASIPYWDPKAKKLCIQMPSWSATGNAYIDLGGDNTNINNSLFISYFSGRDTYINTNTDPNATNKGGYVYLGKTRIGIKRPTGIHTDAQLSVDGKILATSVYVNTTTWADYVFDANYKLPKLSDVEEFINKNKHLPNIPSASEIEKNGLDLGTIQTKQMEKIEELTLYIIELNKKLEAQAKEIEYLKAKK